MKRNNRLLVIPTMLLVGVLTSCGGGSGGGDSGSSGATTITTSGTYSNKTYTSTKSSENALQVNGSINVSLSNSTINKSGDSSGGDDDSFYGYNSAIKALGGANLTLDNVTVNSTAKGGNGVFSYGGYTPKNQEDGSGDGTTITANSCNVTTTKDNAGGFMTTGDGISVLNSCTAVTSGDSSAAIRTDRGGGTVTATGGSYITSGSGSPAIYSTAAVTVKDAELTSKHSEGVIVEGKNSVTLNNCTLEDTNDKLNGQSTTYKNIFLYQSMSGDAETGNSSFNATDSKIKTHYGDDIYVTNQTTVITLTNNTFTNDYTGTRYFLRAQEDAWGTKDKGGKVTLNFNNQTAQGDIYIDAKSTLAWNLDSTSSYTGTINGANTAGTLTIKAESGCSIKLTDTSYVTATPDVYTLSCIDVTDGHLYLNDGTKIK